MQVLPHLGVCYYPEHWPEEGWETDARRMAALGLAYVRIGEFAWSRLEPQAGRLDFDWLERAIDTLHGAGLKTILGTPTATPPRWLVDRMPDMLPVGPDGTVREFGSRRHYCFSHPGYRAECRRIVTELARRFGDHPGVAGWQTDNEYDCHDTALCYSPAALDAFRDWLAQKYQSPDALNRAWGNVFWSMEYADFSEVGLPNATVAGANPAHWMDFRRFSSDQVVSFNRLQTDIIRRHSPGRPIIHNFMGRIFGFDHFDVGADLDISSWDSYPLGFLADRAGRSEAERQRFLRAGDPDFQAFHHDLYRATSGGRWWVMEQQPGPVNWAPYNPVPRDGMVRLWSLEAIAHGAEVVSYFRWRQAPFAQEQMHAGLLRSDGAEAPASGEAAQVMEDIGRLETVDCPRADVVIVYDYPSAWAWDIQPQGKDFDYFALVFAIYRALRRLGLNVDFTSAAKPDLDGRKLVLVPGLFAWSSQLVEALRSCRATVLVGPRSGSKTEHFAIPDRLPPDLSADLLDAVVERVDTLPDTALVDAPDAGGHVHIWREAVTVGAGARVEISDGEDWPLLLAQGTMRYLAGWPNDEAMFTILGRVAGDAGLETCDLPAGLRMRLAGARTFLFNYDNAPIDISAYIGEADLLVGTPVLEPSGVAVLAG